MWIFTNRGFVSIVAPIGTPEDVLVVRGRFAGDLEALFPGFQAHETPDRDYRFRILVPRDQVATWLAEQARQLAYTNFKDSVRENWRHDCYLDVWTVMNRWQHARIPKPRTLRPIGRKPKSVSAAARLPDAQPQPPEADGPTDPFGDLWR